jgi:hypothetical protein
MRREFETSLDFLRGDLKIWLELKTRQEARSYVIYFLPSLSHYSSYMNCITLIIEGRLLKTFSLKLTLISDWNQK